MMNFIYETLHGHDEFYLRNITWTFSKENSHTHKHPK